MREGHVRSPPLRRPPVTIAGHCGTAAFQEGGSHSDWLIVGALAELLPYAFALFLAVQVTARCYSRKEPDGWTLVPTRDQGIP